MENIGSAAEQKDMLAARTHNEKLCAKNGVKDLEGEPTDKGKPVHGLGGALPDATEQGDGMDESPTQKGGTEEEVELTVANKQQSLEARKKIRHSALAAGRGRRHQIMK